MSGFKFKSLSNVNCYRKNNVYFLSNKTDFKKWFKFLSEIVLVNFKDCNLIYTENGTISDIEIMDVEKIIDNSNIVIFPVTNRFLKENKNGLRLDLELAILKHKVIIPISEEDLDLKLYKEIFGNLQYYKKKDADIGNKELIDKIIFGLNSRFFEESVQKEKYKIFISYRKDDRELVKELIDKIHHHELGLVFSFWFDNFLFPGEDYKHEIETAINEADLVIFLGSKNLLNTSNYVYQVEYPYAINEAKKPAIGLLLDDVKSEEFTNLYEKVEEIAQFNDIESIFGLLEKHFDFNETKKDVNDRNILYKYASLYCANVGTYNDANLGVEILERMFKKGDVGAAGGLATYYKNIITLTNSAVDDEKWSYYSNIVFDYYFKKLQNDEELTDNEISILISSSEEIFERSPNLVVGKLDDLMKIIKLVYSELNKSSEKFNYYIDKFINLMFMNLIHVKYQLDYNALLECIDMLSNPFRKLSYTTRQGDYIPEIELVLNYSISIKAFMMAKNNQLDSSLSELINLLGSQINKALDFYSVNEDTYLTILMMSSALAFVFFKNEKIDDAIEFYNRSLSAYLKCYLNEKFVYPLQYESYFAIKNFGKMFLTTGDEYELEGFARTLKRRFLALYNEQIPMTRAAVYIAKMLNVMHFRTYFLVDDVDVDEIKEFNEEINAVGLPDNAFSYTSNVEFEMLNLNYLDEGDDFISDDQFEENMKFFKGNDGDSIVEETIADSIELRLEHDLFSETVIRFYEFFDIEYRKSFDECLKMFKRIYKMKGTHIYEFENYISTFVTYMEFLAEVGDEEEYIKMREELLEIFETMPYETLKELDDIVSYVTKPVDDINDDKISIKLYKAICDLSDAILNKDLISGANLAKEVKILLTKAENEFDLESDMLPDFANRTLEKYKILKSNN